MKFGVPRGANSYKGRTVKILHHDFVHSFADYVLLVQLNKVFARPLIVPL